MAGKITLDLTDDMLGSFEVKIVCGGRQPQLLHTQS